MKTVNLDCSLSRKGLRMELIDYSETVPIQYETGKALFMGMELEVDPRVLIPRPETELLVRTAIDLCQGIELDSPFLLEIGTGSGIIPLGITKFMKDSRIISTDISEDALIVAKKNIDKFASACDIRLIRSDMFKELDKNNENSFDGIISNPPYVSDKDYEKLDAWVKAEPEIALRGGIEGRDAIDTIISGSYRFLKIDGFLAIEVGYDQAEKVKDLLTRRGFSGVTGFTDHNGHERVVVGRKKG